ncbi:class I SAM-dependent methyltransferase [Algoriphagus sp. PAP.12]|uniref:class I SAM-dependent methyltransferase n=1 Tax=Algoriphagus sp. PAP.12 TaxID=2996678 RepID=UPI00227B72EA|nr:class I SAM-dependent methyltransferase [Algoriphagus sp. PAP.12]
MAKYIHGYIPEEQERLLDQAGVLAPLIYPWIDFSECNHVLEIGSGVGAQSHILLSLYPDIELSCVEIEKKQVKKAKHNLTQFIDRKIHFLNQDASKLELKKEVDGVFVCWVLEHLSDPLAVLSKAFENLSREGVIFLTEVFNSSFHYYPQLPGLSKYYKVFNDYQRSLGGDPDVGLKLGNLLKEAGFSNIELHRGGFHLDQTQPHELQKICTYWKGLMKSGAEAIIEEGLISREEVLEMEQDLDKITKHPEGVLYYQFIQAKAKKP